MERGHEVYIESRTDWMACVLEDAANFTGVYNDQSDAAYVS